MILLDGKHWLQNLRDHQKAGDVARVEAHLLLRCITVHDGRPIEGTDVLMPRKLTNKVTSIIRRDSSFVAKVMSIMDLSSAFEKERGMSFFDQMVDIVEGIVSAHFPIDIIPRTYQFYIQVAWIHLQRSDAFSIFEYVDVEETESWMLCISLYDDGILFMSLTEKGPLLVRATSHYVLKPKKHNRFHALSSSRVEQVFCARKMTCTRIGKDATALPFLYFTARPFPRVSLQPRV